MREPPPNAPPFEHAAWRRAVGRAWRQYRAGGVAIKTLTQRFGKDREALAQIGESFGKRGRT